MRREMNGPVSPVSPVSQMTSSILPKGLVPIDDILSTLRPNVKNITNNVNEHDDDSMVSSASLHELHATTNMPKAVRKRKTKTENSISLKNEQSLSL